LSSSKLTIYVLYRLEGSGNLLTWSTREIKIRAK